MKIVIATVKIPFLWGGAEYLAKDLQINLEKAGHQAEIVALPFKWKPPERIPEHMLAYRLFDLVENCGEYTDMLIGLKFPAYYLQHPNKVLWILHQQKQAYEQWGTKYCDLPYTPSGSRIREAILKADNTYLPEAKKIFTISNTVSSRLYRNNNIISSPLYPPCPGLDNYYCTAYENYVLFISRFTEVKRQHLAVEAMRHVKSSVKLYMAGLPDALEYVDDLKKAISEYKLEEKIKLFDYISDKEKYELYARCRAVLYPPNNEDYGYVSMEAFSARKAVITCTDSGGPLEFVDNNETGFICEPDPEKLAVAIDALGSSDFLAMQMGERAFEKLKQMDISWDKVVKELIGN
jgi:glycosyltransferase involved in cell wall biosynthesis